MLEQAGRLISIAPFGEQGTKKYVPITILHIPDFREGRRKDGETNKKEEESDSDEGYGDEDEPAQEAPKDTEETIKPK